MHGPWPDRRREHKPHQAGHLQEAERCGDGPWGGGRRGGDGGWRLEWWGDGRDGEWGWGCAEEEEEEMILESVFEAGLQGVCDHGASGCGSGCV